MLKSYQSPMQGNVRRCENLRPARQGEKSKNAVTALAVTNLSLLTEGHFTPVGMFGSDLIVNDGDNLYAVSPDTGETEEIAPLSGRRVVYGLPSSDGERFLISTSTDYILLTRSSSGITAENVSAEATGMPYFTTAGGMPCSAVVPSRALSYAYTGTEAVRSADARNLSADLVEAYRHIANQSAAAGDFLQPSLVRYRLLDVEGNEIFASPHILVGVPNACEAQTVEFADTTHKSTASYTLSATGTALTLHIPAQVGGIFARFAARLEVVCTPMLQPYQPGAPIHCTRKVNSHTGEFAVLHLPGASFGQFSPGSACAPSMLRRMISVAGCERVLTVINDPFGGEEAKEIAVSSSGLSIEREIADMRAVLDSPVVASTSSQALLRAPHRIDACVSASASGLTLASGLSVRRFRGWELPLIATESTGADPWQAIVTVIFNDGSRLSMPAEGVGGTPEKVSPVVTYPAPDVASIAIQLSVQGQPLRVMSLPMTPDASYRFSVYVSKGLQAPGWREVEGVLTVPPDISAPLPQPGIVAVCGQGNLFHVHTTANIGAEVKALQPGARALGAWDFGRVRFLCGGEGGIHALTVNAARSAVAVNLLHPGEVKSAGAMTQCLDGEVAAIASGDLLTIHGATVTTRLGNLGDAVLGWHAPERTLFIAPEGGGCVTAICPNMGYRGYSVAAQEISEMYTTPGGVVMFGSEGIYRPCAPDANAETPVSWHCVFPGPWRGRLRLCLPLSATYFDGTISLCHRHLEADGAVMSQYTVCGTIHSPLMLSASVPPCDALMLKIEGVSSADCLLRQPEISKFIHP